MNELITALTRLANAAARTGHDSFGPAPFPSLPDLWNTLPPTFAGRVAFEDEEWLTLFCALADPPRFGTDFGRYPEQLAGIRHVLGAAFLGEGTAKSPQNACGDLAVAAPKENGSRSLFRLLDLGCGTGQGTYELAETAAGVLSVPVFALGVTREPLEVWMAEQRRLPHDPERERQFQRRTQNSELRTEIGKAPAVRFLVGDALAAPCDGPFDLVTANGLVGGRFLRTPQALERFLDEVERLLAPDGLLALANRFHEGERPALEAFADSARRRGWQTDGTPENLLLRRNRNGG